MPVYISSYTAWIFRKTFQLSRPAVLLWYINPAAVKITVTINSRNEFCSEKLPFKYRLMPADAAAIPSAEINRPRLRNSIARRQSGAEAVTAPLYAVDAIINILFHLTAHIPNTAAKAAAITQ